MDVRFNEKSIRSYKMNKYYFVQVSEQVNVDPVLDDQIPIA